MPPYLAGREREKQVFREFLTDLSNGHAPGTQVILHGPRGNGKTVLLGWLRKAVAQTAGVEALTLPAAELPNETRLREVLASRSWWRRLASGAVTAAGVSWKPDSVPLPSSRDLLAARARRTALVVLADEAHTLDLGVGRTLLNAAQEVGTERPCLLVLAGTPNLEGRLNAMGASFWDRAEILRIGRLDDEATREALRRPFASEGIEVDDGALEVMAREAQNYPYFVQAIGSSVWSRTVAGTRRRRATAAVVEEALSDFRTRKAEYYRQRVEELMERDLLPVGVAVAEAFRSDRLVSHTGLLAAVTSGLGRGATKAERRDAIGALRDLGFLWRVEGELAWEPGIPSLMDYTRDVSARH